MALAMDFFPVELTIDEMVYIDEIVDDILQESRVRYPSDTVISFLKSRVHYPVHTNVSRHVSMSATLQKYKMLSVPSLLFLHDFMLE